MSEDLAEHYNRRWNDEKRMRELLNYNREFCHHVVEARRIRDAALAKEKQKIERRDAQRDRFKSGLLVGYCVGFGVAAAAAALLFIVR